jgi:ferritin
MNNLKTGYYQADNQNGISFIGDILEDENQDVTDIKTFIDCLDTLDNNEMLLTFFDAENSDDLEILEELQEKYGIH